MNFYLQLSLLLLLTRVKLKLNSVPTDRGKILFLVYALAAVSTFTSLVVVWLSVSLYKIKRTFHTGTATDRTWNPAFLIWLLNQFYCHFQQSHQQVIQLHLLKTQW